MFAIALALLMVLSACSSAPQTGPAAGRALIDESAAVLPSRQSIEFRVRGRVSPEEVASLGPRFCSRR